MSQEKKKLLRLADVFRDNLDRYDGDTGRAFIAVLDELDRRQGLVEADIHRNTGLFNDTVKALNTVSAQQDKLPARVQGATESVLQATLPLIGRRSQEGAKEGAKPATRGLETLISASEDYEERKRWLTTFAAVGLPLAFCTAFGLGIILGSFGIRQLPASWQWTCKLIGAEHITQENGLSYCIVRKQ